MRASSLTEEVQVNASQDEERYVSEKEFENGMYEIGERLYEPLQRGVEEAMLQPKRVKTPREGN